MLHDEPVSTVGGAPPPKEYPVQLGLAYLLLVGYLVRTLFVSLKLPASVGVILTGFAFSYFIQVDIFFGRDLLQELAFFLVLLTAGLEISLQELRGFLFVLAWLPCTVELLAITIYAFVMLEFTFVEGLNLGTVLVAIGDGLVIPKMKEFSSRFDHPMSHVMFMWAPLEACYALTIFGMLKGLSAPASMPEVDLPSMVLANIVRIVATLAFGTLMGYLSGLLIAFRTKASLFGHQVFTGASVEAFLMLLSVALAAFGLGASGASGPMVPIVFSSGSLFQPELLVIVTGSTFAHACTVHNAEDLLHQVENIMGGVWVFGQLVLFSMLGSRTTLSIFPDLKMVLPIMAVGLAARLVGVVLAVWLTRESRGCGKQELKQTLADAAFCFLATCPRATIQGALGAVPVNQRFFQDVKHRDQARDFIFTAARLYIVCMSVCGMFFLNTFGPLMLQASVPRPDEEKVALGSGVDEGGHELLEQLDARGDALDHKQSERVMQSAAVLGNDFGLECSEVLEILHQARLRRQKSADVNVMPTLREEQGALESQVVASHSHYSAPVGKTKTGQSGSSLSLIARTVSEPAFAGKQHRTDWVYAQQRHKAIKRLYKTSPLAQFDERGASTDELSDFVGPPGTSAVHRRRVVSADS